MLEFGGFWQVMVEVLKRWLNFLVLLVIDLHKLLARANQNITIDHGTLLELVDEILVCALQILNDSC